MDTPTDYKTISRPNPSHNFSRITQYAVLSLFCIGGFSHVFCYENPIPIQKQMEDNMGISTSQYTLLFSLYSFPNIIISFFVGYLADCFGRRKAIVACGMFIFIGETFFAFGVIKRSFVLATIGRFIFGIGAEPHSVVALETLSFWNYQFLPISLALDVAAKKAGAGLSSLLTPYVYDQTQSLNTIFYIGFGISILCLLTTIIFAILECYNMRGQGQSASNREMSFGDILSFPKIFWLYIFYMGFFYAVINSLFSLSSGMAQTRFGFSVGEAGVLYFTALGTIIVFNLIFGFILDYFRKFTVFALVASLILVGNFIYLTILPDNSSHFFVYVFFIIHGIASSLFITSYWPGIKFLIPNSYTTTAYGIAYCAQNIMLFLGPISAGMIIDKTEARSGGYFGSSLLFLGLSVITVIIGIIIFFWDHDGNAVLYKGKPIYEEYIEANPQ